MTNAEIIYSYLRKAGCTFDGAVGILGNLQGESGSFNPLAVEGMNNKNTSFGKSGLSLEEYTARAMAGQATINGKQFIKDSLGYGIVQWTYWARKQNLLNFAKEKNKSIGDLTLQLDFMLYEVQNNYKTAWTVATDGSDYKKVVKIWVNDYEKPANASSAIEKRTAYAKQWYSYFQNWTEETGKVEEKASTVEEKEEIQTTPTTSTGTDRRAVVKIALAQLGYREKRSNSQLDDATANAGTNNYTKYARDLDAISGFYNGKKNGHAWCDIFVDWCFVQAYGVDKAVELLCQKMGGSGAGCTYSLGYYSAKGQFVKRSEGKPQVGDQIFFGTGVGNSTHTGLVIAVDDKSVHTVEGNTNDNPTVVAEGIGVYYKSYALNKTSIIGYGRPKFNDGYTGNGFELQGADTSDVEEKEATEEKKEEPVKVEEKAAEKTEKKSATDVSASETTAPTNSTTTSANGVYDRRKFIDVAMNEVGYLEKKSNKNLDDPKANAGEGDYTKYARDLDAISDFYYHDSKQGLAWCDVFVDWCFVQAFGFEGALAANCQPKKSYGAGCNMSAKYYRDKGRLDNAPQVGDQFFINNWTHTGIVIEVRSSSVVTIEGNQDVSNGQQGVVQKVRLRSEIDGFGHPNYNDGLAGKFYWNKDRTDLKQTSTIGETKVEEKAEPVIEQKVEEKAETSEKETTSTISGLVLEEIKEGSKNSLLIKVLQLLLKTHGYSVGMTGIDGDFGSATKKALINYQARNGLSADGICDERTWRKLFNLE